METKSEVGDQRIRAIRESYAASNAYDLRQILSAVRCPIHDSSLTRIEVINGEPHYEGCCGAMAEASRVLQNT